STQIELSTVHGVAIGSAVTDPARSTDSISHHYRYAPRQELYSEMKSFGALLAGSPPTASLCGIASGQVLARQKTPHEWIRTDREFPTNPDKRNVPVHPM